MHAIRKLIQQATDAPDGDLAMIENIMRMEVFHSTLDWQTETQLRRGAREAQKILEENRELYENYQHAAYVLFNNMKEEQP